MSLILGQRLERGMAEPDGHLAEKVLGRATVVQN